MGIATAGLVSFIDPGNTASYSGSGSTVYDLSGKGVNWTIQGNVSWDSTQGWGNFTGNSTGGGNKIYLNQASVFYNLKTSQTGGQGYTVCVWAKSTGGQGAWRKLIANADGENYLDLYQNASSPYGWHQDGSGEYLYYNDAIYVANDSLAMPDSVWRMYVALNYNNGTTSNPSTALTLGNEPNGSGTGANAYPWVGQIGPVMIYNRVLSKQEIANNFYTFNSRFGVSGSNISAAGMLLSERVISPSNDAGVFAKPSVDKDVVWLVPGELSVRHDGFKTPTNKTKATWSYTGGDQSWTVPSGVFYIWAKLWGAGGGGGCAGGWTHGAEGGGGGHSYGLIQIGRAHV